MMTGCTTLPQIFCEFLLNFKVIPKNTLGTDEVCCEEVSRQEWVNDLLNTCGLSRFMPYCPL